MSYHVQIAPIAEIWLLFGMFVRTRKIKGRSYRYLEYRWREGWRVRSKSVCLGAGSGMSGGDGQDVGFLRRQLGRRYGIDWDLALEQFNAKCEREAQDRQAQLDRLHVEYGLKLGPERPSPVDRPMAEASSPVSSSALSDGMVTAADAKESPSDDGGASEGSV